MGRWGKEDDPLSAIVLNNRRLLLVDMDGDWVIFQVRRVRMIDLMEDGYVEAVGPGAVEAHRQSEILRVEREGRMATCTTPEARAALEAEFLAADRAEADAKLRDMAPEDMARLMARSEAAMLAGLEGIGWPNDKVELMLRLPDGDEAKIYKPGILPEGTAPVDVCQGRAPDTAGGGPIYLRPLRVTRGETGPGRLPLSEFTDKQIMLLGGLIMILSIGGNREVSTFRRS